MATLGREEPAARGPPRACANALCGTGGNGAGAALRMCEQRRLAVPPRNAPGRHSGLRKAPALTPGLALSPSAPSAPQTSIPAAPVPGGPHTAVPVVPGAVVLEHCRQVSQKPPPRATRVRDTHAPFQGPVGTGRMVRPRVRGQQGHRSHRGDTEAPQS